MSGLWYSTDIDRFVSRAGFVNVTRQKGHKAFFRNGKKLHTFAFVVSGCIRYEISGEQPIMADGGTLIYIPKRIEYKADYIDEESTVKVMTFDYTEDTDDGIFIKPFHLKSRRVKELFGNINRQNGVNRLYLAAKLYELMWLIGEMNVGLPEKYQRLLPAIQRLEQDYSENLKMAYYADMIGMSESNFRKLFKEYVGMPPIDYRNSIRVREAQKMIQSGECTVQEAAYLAGFNNMSFFYETYKKQFGTGKIK